MSVVVHRCHGGGNVGSVGRRQRGSKRAPSLILGARTNEIPPHNGGDALSAVGVEDRNVHGEVVGPLGAEDQRQGRRAGEREGVLRVGDVGWVDR